MSVRATDDKLCGRTPENDPRRSQATGESPLESALMHAQTNDGDKKCSSTYPAPSFVES